MKYLVLALLLTGCDYHSWLPNNPPKYTPIICNNLICFPDYVARVGPDFETKEECEAYIEGKTDRSKMEFVYCREN